MIVERMQYDPFHGTMHTLHPISTTSLGLFLSSTLGSMNLFRVFVIGSVIHLNPAVYGQDLMPFPLIGGTWYYDWGTSDCLNSGAPMPGVIYTTPNDTVIAGTTYRALHRDGVCVGCCEPLGTPANGYLGALRESMVERMVYILPADSSEERILFDFSKEAGDLITGWNPTGQPSSTYQVTDIDSILLGDGAYHRRWILDGGDNSTLVEGVGFTTGFVETFAWNMEQTARLNCFVRHDTIIYPNGGTDCEIPTTVMEDVSTRAGAIYVTLDEQMEWTLYMPPLLLSGMVTITVYDLQGRQTRRWTERAQEKISLTPFLGRPELILLSVALTTNTGHVSQPVLFKLTSWPK